MEQRVDIKTIKIFPTSAVITKTIVLMQNGIFLQRRMVRVRVMALVERSNAWLDEQAFRQLQSDTSLLLLKCMTSAVKIFQESNFSMCQWWMSTKMRKTLTCQHDSKMHAR